MSDPIRGHEAIYSPNEFYAYCSLCSDRYGNPVKFDRRGITRHLETDTHMRNTQRAARARSSNDTISSGHNLVSSIERLEVTPVPPSLLFPEHGHFDTNITQGPTPDHERREENLPTLRDYLSGLRDIDSDAGSDLFLLSQEHNGDFNQQGGGYSSEESESGWETDPGPARGTYDGAEALLDDSFKYTFGQFNHVPNSETRNEWWPWANKAVFLADVITNSRRLKFTRRQIRAVLAYARECGAKDVPSMSALKKAQAALKKKLGNPTVQKVSASGNVFYMNRIAFGIAQDFANPYLREHMNLYPHFDDNRMSQIWHGTKMVTKIPDHVLTPMIRHNKQTFYVNELVRRDNEWFLPLRWMLYGKKKEMYAMGYAIQETEGGLHVVTDKRRAVPVSTFVRSYPDLVACDAVPRFDDASQEFAQSMPHPIRAVAESRMVYSIPVILFIDDVSGNKTRQFNKHNSSYCSNGALTREVLNAEYNVRFVLTSQHGNPVELMQGILEDLDASFQNPTVAYDCDSDEEVLIRPYPIFCGGDNPMQAELCSCQHQKANFFCRTCGVGGTTDFKQSEEGYASLLKPGDPRTPAQTLDRVNQLLDLSIQPSQKMKTKDQARDWGVKDTLAQPVIDQLQRVGQALRNKKTSCPGVSESEILAHLQAELSRYRAQGCVNKLLDENTLGLNMHLDTPTEILHTVLLGVVKYFWGQTIFVLKNQIGKLESRLNGLNVSGTSISSLSASYLCHYSGSLVGKHFKMIAQTMAFACHDLVKADLLEAWLLLGRLTMMLWYPEIDNITSYLKELRSIIDDFLIAAARCSPSIIVHKPKFHFLVHLPSFVERFGPALLFSTERFESFHGVFRAGSLNSNHHAPSRDIAEYFVGLDRVKHICSGGYWLEGKKWVQADPHVSHFLSNHSVFSTLLGLPSDKRATPVTEKSPPSNDSIPLPWPGFSANKHLFPYPCPQTDSENHLYYHLRSAASLTRENIVVGCDVLLGHQVLHTRQKQKNSLGSGGQGMGRPLLWCSQPLVNASETLRAFGRIEALFCCNLSSSRTPIGSYASVRLYKLGKTKHRLFDMPILTLGEEVICEPIDRIKCIANLQHDCCLTGECTEIPVQERQEREETSHTRHTICHSDSSNFVLNIMNLHNIQYIHQALPKELLQWRGLGVDATVIRKDAIRRLASAAMNKSLQADARKAAKSAFNTVMEAQEQPENNETQATQPPRKRRRISKPVQSASSSQPMGTRQ